MKQGDIRKELEYARKGPETATHSAVMPAYCYTAACPVLELREPMWRRKRY